MGRFDFQSPGAAFTGQIADVLARRKADERQRMLDTLTKNADMRSQEQLALQQQQEARDAKESDARMADMDMQRRLQRLGIITGNMDAGDDPTAFGVSPEDVEHGKSLGMFKEQRPQIDPFRAPQGATVEEVGADMAAQEAAPPSIGYVGTPQQRDRQRLREQHASLISSLVQNPDKREDGQFLKELAEANDGMIPEGALAKFMAPPKTVILFDQATGRFTVNGKAVDASRIPQDAEVVTLPRPPREHRPRNLMQVLDPDGNLAMIDQESLPIDPATGIAKLPQGYTQARGSGSAASREATKLGISQGAYDTYGEELSLLEPDETGKVKNMLGVRRAVSTIIGEANVPLKIKELARRFALNPDSIASETLSEKESLQLKQLLNVLAPDPSIFSLYKQNSIQTNKPGDVIKGITSPSQPTAAPMAPSTNVPYGLTRR